MSNGWNPVHLTEVARQATQIPQFAGVCANGIWTSTGRMWDAFPFRTPEFNIGVDERCQNPRRHWVNYRQGAQYLDLLMQTHDKDEWEPVWSCFGGAMLYLRSALIQCRYASPHNDDPHVALHTCLRRKGGELFLDPKWVMRNNHYQTDEPVGPLYALAHRDQILNDYKWCNSHTDADTVPK